MSETAGLRVKFESKEDAKKAYEILVANDKKFSEMLYEPTSEVICDNGAGQSYDDYDFFGHAARVISKQGIKYSGEATYASLSTGDEQEERFSCDGGELIVLDEHHCRGCNKIVSSKNGVSIWDGTGELWYCDKCGKEYLVDIINEYLEDNDESIEDYSSNSDLESMTIAELADIASQMDDCLEITLPSCSDEEDEEDDEDDEDDDY